MAGEAGPKVTKSDSLSLFVSGEKSFAFDGGARLMRTVTDLT